MPSVAHAAHVAPVSQSSVHNPCHDGIGPLCRIHHPVKGNSSHHPAIARRSRPLPDTGSFRTLWGETAGNGTRRGGLIGPAKSNGGVALPGGSPHVRAAIVRRAFEYHGLYDPNLKLDVPRECADGDMSGESCVHLSEGDAPPQAATQLAAAGGSSGGRDEL